MKHKTRDSALPRRRSAPALALQKPQHRQRVIPDKRRAANERAANEEVRAVALGLEPLRRGPAARHYTRGPAARHYTRGQCEEHLVACVQSYNATTNTVALCDCGGEGPCNWIDGHRKPVN